MNVESRVRARLVTGFENLDFARNLLGSRLRILHAPRRVSRQNVAVIKKRTTDMRLANAILYQK